VQIHRPVVDFDERAVGVADEALRKGQLDVGGEWRQRAVGVADSMLLIMGREGRLA
jgi:hypothetical protein